MNKFNKIILTENVKHHINSGLSIDECVFRLGSESFNDVVNTLRELNESYDLNLSEDDMFIIEKLKTGTKAVTRDGDNVTLDSPQRISGGKKKFRVYRDSGKKNDKGVMIAKKIEWGDPNLSVKNGDPKAAKSFRARHKCSEKTDKDTPGWWACNAPSLFHKQLGLQSSDPW